MRGFMLLCLVTLASSATKVLSYPDIQQQPHLEYGPISSLPQAALFEFPNNLQALMDLQTANIDSNSIDQYIATQQEENNFPVLPQHQYESRNFDGTANTYETTPVHFTQQQPVISKRFFLHSAPEEDDTEVQHRQIIIGKPRKNFNVVFIRAPAKSAQRTSIKISSVPNEERNIIYVLTKKHDVDDIATHVVEPVTMTTKPEVFFIKYKTNEEAEHAQRAIQSQYNILGGSTHISNEGVARFSSVIEALDEAKYDTDDEAQYVAEEYGNEQNFQNQQTQTEDVTSINKGYLPPTSRKY